MSGLGTPSCRAYSSQTSRSVCANGAFPRSVISERNRATKFSIASESNPAQVGDQRRYVDCIFHLESV
jgi:hypothetical protein